MFVFGLQGEYLLKDRLLMNRSLYGQLLTKYGAVDSLRSIVSFHRRTNIIEIPSYSMPRQKFMSWFDQEYADEVLLLKFSQYMYFFPQCFWSVFDT